MCTIIATKSSRARGAAGAPAAGREEHVRYPLPRSSRSAGIPVSLPAPSLGDTSHGGSLTGPPSRPRDGRGSGRSGRAPRGGK